MFTSIQFNSLSSFALFTQQPALNSLVSEPIQRIKEVVLAVFSRIYEFFHSFNKPSSENNLKAFALISCFSLIVLLFISILRRRHSHPFPAPLEQDIAIE